MRLNPDKQKVKEIRDALKSNGGFCPCSLIHDNDHKCPCRKFREEKICCCELYVD